MNYINLRHFLKSHSSLTSINKTQNTPLPLKADDITVIEVINNSLTILDDQDKNLLNVSNWSYFSKYDKNYKQYVKVSDNDIQIMENLDFIINSKQKPRGKVIKSNIGRRIYCKLLLKNCLSVNTLCKEFRFNCRFQQLSYYVIT